jgi:hypothetical protein
MTAAGRQDDRSAAAAAAAAVAVAVAVAAATAQAHRTGHIQSHPSLCSTALEVLEAAVEAAAQAESTGVQLCRAGPASRGAPPARRRWRWRRQGRGTQSPTASLCEPAAAGRRPPALMTRRGRRRPLLLRNLSRIWIRIT